MVFTNKTKTLPDRRKSSSYSDSAVTILTPGCHFDGKFFCRGSSRIAGKIEGQIISEGLLIIEECATIQAEISAENVVIQGTVSGTLTAIGRVEIASTGIFNGDIACPTLIIHEGAQFNGTSKMSGTTTIDINKNMKKVAANNLTTNTPAVALKGEPEIHVGH